MQNIADKVEDGGATAGGRLGASEYNNHKNENQNVVTRSGQSFSAGSEDQLSIAAAIHGMASSTFIDSGTANTIEITPATGASGILLPLTYPLFEGAKVSFYVNAANTGATTLNIGQTNGTLLGAKKLWRNGNTELLSGDLVPGRLITAIFDTSLDAAAGAWVMTDPSSTQTTGTAAIFHAAHTAAAGSGGGTSLAGAFQTRVINTVYTNNIEGSSLGGNAVTLPAGKYWVEACAPALKVGSHAIRIVQVSGPTTLFSGRKEESAGGDATQTTACASGLITLASTQQLQISHFTELAVVTVGLGNGFAANPDNEVFAEIKIWKL